MARGTWEDGPNLPAAIFNAKMVNFDGTIYLIGGQYHSSNTSADIYLLEKTGSSPASWKFQKVGRLNKEKAFFGAVPIKLNVKDCNGWK